MQIASNNSKFCRSLFLSTIIKSFRLSRVGEIFPEGQGACSLKLSRNVLETITNKNNAELQRANPGTKVSGQFSTSGRILPHPMPKMDFHYSHCFS